MAKKRYSDIDLSKYSKGYQASQDVINAQKLKENAENAVKNYGDFKYSNQAGLQAAMDAITNRKAFSYDLNADALYQQYKDNYISQGKQAMMDATGQAAALTGGYGNSYANAVGNQAYQGYLQGLNNIIPDLYNLALSAYQTEGDRLKDTYGILLDDRNTEYGMWGDKYNRLVSDRGYYADAYNNAYAQDYGMWNDNRNYDTSQYWNEYQANYQAERDAIADAQWQKEFNLAASRAGGGGSSGGGGGTPTYGDIAKGKTDNAQNFVRTIPSYVQWGTENKKNADNQEEVARNNKEYAQYVDAKIGEAYDAGNIDMNELAYIMDYFHRTYGVEF